MASQIAFVRVDQGIIKEVSPDPIRMGTKQNQFMEWSIVSSDPSANYTFPADGIGIASGTDTTQQFRHNGNHDDGTPLGPVQDGKRFRMHNKNSNRKLYKYTVKVMSGDTALAPLDPGISNGDG